MTRGRENPLALAVLALLFERPMHPYEMATTLRERRKEDSIKLNHGSLYSVVQALEKRGAIKAREVQKDGGRPERTFYELTERGSVELVDWLSELLAAPAKEFTQFEAALALTGCLRPEDTVRLLEERVARLEEELAATQALMGHLERSELPRLFYVETEYRMALRRAELDFVASLAAEIREETIEGIRDWRAYHDALEALAAG